MGQLIEIIKSHLKNNKKVHRHLRLLKRQFLAKTTGYPNWSEILRAHQSQWKQALEVSQKGPNILIATSIGGYLAGVTMESMLGVALTLRKVQVHVLLCDTILPACFDCEVTWYPKLEHFLNHGPSKDLCRHCYVPASRVYGDLGFAVHRFSDFLTQEDFQFSDKMVENLTYSEIVDYKYEGIPIGEHALSGALRFFACANLEKEVHGEAVLKRYFKAALLTVISTKRLLSKNAFKCLTFHHGIYVPQGLIGEVARQKNIPVVNWNVAYRKHCFIFSHRETYHHSLISESVQHWEDLSWTPILEKKLLKYLASRLKGSEDWIWFHERPKTDLGAIEKETGIDFSKTTIGLLTNVLWDAQLHYPANAFSNMLEWVLQTIGYFGNRPELQLVIRVHPAELTGTLVSRQPIIREIEQVYPVLPRNVFLVGPESQASTYAMMTQCNAVIIYGTKTGVELASIGIPVIVAGEAWIRNKGISIDASSSREYFSILERLPFPDRLDAPIIERARKYAYHFFFRRMIPLDFMEVGGSAAPFYLKINNLKNLMPGSSKGLDVICQGILDGSEFIFPDEEEVEEGNASQGRLEKVRSGN